MSYLPESTSFQKHYTVNLVELVGLRLLDYIASVLRDSDGYSAPDDNIFLPSLSL